MRRSGSVERPTPSPGGTPLAARTGRSARSARSPRRSPMNSAGGSRPATGSCQRSNASVATISPDRDVDHRLVVQDELAVPTARSSPILTWWRCATDRLMLGSYWSKRPLPFRFAVYIATSACCINSAASVPPFVRRDADAGPRHNRLAFDVDGVAVQRARMSFGEQVHVGDVPNVAATRTRTRRHPAGPPCRGHRRRASPSPASTRSASPAA